MKIYKIATIQTIFDIASRHREAVMSGQWDDVLGSDALNDNEDSQSVTMDPSEEFGKRLSPSVCDLASGDLVEEYLEKGINAKQIFGLFGFLNHSWVEINGKIIVDITADQFGASYPDVFITTYDRSSEYERTDHDQW